MRQNLFALGAGAVFGAGLAVSGMTRPEKVIGFLDVAGAWDPTLAFVMAGALAVHAVAVHFILRRPAPILADRFHLPTRREVDWRLVAGAALFGVGWGLAGYCPGPGVVSLGSGATSALIFVAALLGGSLLHDAWANRRSGGLPPDDLSAR